MEIGVSHSKHLQACLLRSVQYIQGLIHQVNHPFLCQTFPLNFHLQMLEGGDDWLAWAWRAHWKRKKKKKRFHKNSCLYDSHTKTTKTSRQWKLWALKRQLWQMDKIAGFIYYRSIISLTQRHNPRCLVKAGLWQNSTLCDPEREVRQKQVQGNSNKVTVLPYNYNTHIRRSCSTYMELLNAISIWMMPHKCAEYLALIGPIQPSGVAFSQPITQH